MQFPVFLSETRMASGRSPEHRADPPMSRADPPVSRWGPPPAEAGTTRPPTPTAAVARPVGRDLYVGSGAVPGYGPRQGRTRASRRGTGGRELLIGGRTGRTGPTSGRSRGSLRWGPPLR